MTDNVLFCFGYGYCCDFLGHHVQQLDRSQQDGSWKISGTTRDLEKLRALKENGIRTFLFNYETPLDDPYLFLNNATHILISTPPKDDGDPAFLMHADDIARLESLKWIGYLSSTSVYGNRDGEVVDETSAIEPSSQRGARRVRAEDQWMSLYHQYNLPVHIFRLAGIYGPGRSALDTVRMGTARRIDKPGHVFNRIHVDDIVQSLMASMAQPNPGSIYNICDNEAAPSHEVIDHACKLLKIESPPITPYEEANLPPIARSFYRDNKRLDNSKLKNELGVTLKHPNFKHGLDACLTAEREILGKAWKNA